MVIGNGLIGKNLAKIDREEFVFFASGVSNSKSTNENDYLREESLLIQNISINSDKTFVYFSTYSVNDPSLSDYYYIKHKLRMEKIIQQSGIKYLIVRTSNVVGGIGNPGTILRYLFDSIKNEKPFEIWKNAYRNILDVDHLIVMLDETIKRKLVNCIVYLLNPIDYSIPQIITECELILNKKANYISVEKGTGFKYDKTLSMYLFNELNINNEGYINKVISKYLL